MCFERLSEVHLCTLYLVCFPEWGWSYSRPQRNPPAGYSGSVTGPQNKFYNTNHSRANDISERCREATAGGVESSRLGRVHLLTDALDSVQAVQSLLWLLQVLRKLGVQNAHGERYHRSYNIQDKQKWCLNTELFYFFISITSFFRLKLHRLNVQTPWLQARLWSGGPLI